MSAGPNADGSASNANIPALKLLMLGDSGVGKSSIICQFADNVFHQNLISTVGVDFKVKRISHKGQQLSLRIWDTAGQEQFKTITRQYYKGAMGVVLVYDVTDVRTFQHTAYWLRNIQQYASANVACILVANKIDLPNRQVTTEMGQNFAAQVSIPYYECTAKDPVKVEEAFRGIADIIVETLKTEHDATANTVNLAAKDLDKKGCAC